jgi:hypothetical protein
VTDTPMESMLERNDRIGALSQRIIQAHIFIKHLIETHLRGGAGTST